MDDKATGGTELPGLLHFVDPSSVVGHVPAAEKGLVVESGIVEHYFVLSSRRPYHHVFGSGENDRAVGRSNFNFIAGNMYGRGNFPDCLEIAVAECGLEPQETEFSCDVVYCLCFVGRHRLAPAEFIRTYGPDPVPEIIAACVRDALCLQLQRSGENYGKAEEKLMYHIHCQYEVISHTGWPDESMPSAMMMHGSEQEGILI